MSTGGVAFKAAAAPEWADDAGSLDGWVRSAHPTDRRTTTASPTRNERTPACTPRGPCATASAEQCGERPQRGEATDDGHDDAAGDRGTVEIALLGLFRGPHQRHDVADEQGPAEGEDEVTEQVRATEQHSA